MHVTNIDHGYLQQEARKAYYTKFPSVYYTLVYLGPNNLIYDTYTEHPDTDSLIFDEDNCSYSYLINTKIKKTSRLVRSFWHTHFGVIFSARNTSNSTPFSFILLDSNDVVIDSFTGTTINIKYNYIEPKDISL